jgi:hypothetical protein
VTETHDRQMCDACLEQEYEPYRRARLHESKARNDAWTKKFKIGRWPRWDCDLETETLTFSKGDSVQVTADILVVGTVHGPQWEWAWGNPNLPPGSRGRMEILRQFGEEKHWAKLTTLFMEGDECLGVELTAIAEHILGAEGAYRCFNSDKPGNFVYVLAFNTRFIN